VSHCHGTLTLHTYYEVECTEPDCREFDVERHELLVYQEEVNRP
jgi:hypothetical protein